MFAASKTDSASDGGYQISRSLRFNSADSAYLNRTPATTTNRRTWTWSAWVKRGKQGDFSYLFQGSAGNPTGGLDDGTAIRFSNNISQLTVYNLYNSSSTVEVSTSAMFRDPSAWYHIIVAMDTTQATSTDRVKVYVNGVQATLAAGGVYPTLNEDLYVNTNNSHLIGALTRDGGGAQLFNDGLMTEINFIDGTALTPSSFGQTDAQTGVWQPKAYSGSYGTNGFYLNFSDNSNTTAATLGKDYSPNGNNWTPNNFSVTAGAGNDSLVDSPTSYGVDTGVGGTVRGNYATLNPLDKGSTLTLSNGNLDAVGYNGGCTATFGLTSGKWYWETTLGDQYDVGYWGGYGLTKGTPYDVSAAGCAGVIANVGGGTYANGVKIESFTVWATGNVIGLAFDADALTLSVYKNNTKIGVTLTVPAGAVYPTVTQSGTVGDTSTSSSNFGQRPFAYTAPSGFKALCTQNLPTPTIGATTATQAGKYFNSVLYTGTGSSLGVTGVGFQPDWVWAKSRSATTDHALYDAVRGVQKQLESNTTTAETTETTGLTAFGSDGFTTGALAQMNTSSATYVAWNWKANGSGSTNTAGSITSTVSANTTSGFSVVTYTGNGTSGATVGHGLGVTPAMYIVKKLTISDWSVYHASIGATGALRLNLTAGTDVTVVYWNNTAPTSSVFSIGNAADINQNSANYVSYCFAPIAGYSAFGSYTGNASADGPFIFTGFKPAFVLIKSSTVASSSWRLWDAKRSTYNVVNSSLFPNLSNAEVSTADYAIDFLSNGIKIRAADDGQNYSGGTFIYAAFAESPFKYSLAR